MAGKKGEQLCPICDSPLEPGSKKCGFCGTDLTLFDVESEAPKEEPKEEPKTVTAAEPADDKLDEVFFGADEEEPTKTVSEPVATAEPEPVQAEVTPEPVEPSPEPETVVEEPKEELVEAPVVQQPAPTEESFECPECGGRVVASAKSCSSCGVIFADEGADMFQCPACNTLVNVDAKSCPGCGAMFVESEEEATREAQPEMVAPPRHVEQPKYELEKPVSQVFVEPEGDASAEPSEAAGESEKKSLFGGLFGRKKRKKQEVEPQEEEEVSEGRPEFPSILRRAPDDDRREETAEPEIAPEPEARPEPAFRSEPEPEPERRVVHEPAPVAATPPKPAPYTPKDKTKGKELARLTAEIQPLLRLAIEKGVDVSESRKLVDEGAMSVRARQMDDALESVSKARETLLESLTNSIEQIGSDLRSEAKVARDLGGEVSRATAYLDELEKAKSAGDFEAVFVYAEKAKNELLPITGRYNESRQKISSLRNLVSDSEVININTKDARAMLNDAARAFESNDFDGVDLTVRSATDKLYKDIEPRMEEEIRRARDMLVDLKERGQNITPMITVLKSARTLMKSKDYPQALKEMREFKEQVRKAQ